MRVSRSLADDLQCYVYSDDRGLPYRTSSLRDFPRLHHPCNLHDTLWHDSRRDKRGCQPGQCLVRVHRGLPVPRQTDSQHLVQDTFHGRCRTRPLFRLRHEARSLPQDPTEDPVLCAGYCHHPGGFDSGGRNSLDAWKCGGHLHCGSAKRFHLPQRTYGLLVLNHLGPDWTRPPLLSRQNLLWPITLFLDRPHLAADHILYLQADEI